MWGEPCGGQTAEAGHINPRTAIRPCRLAQVQVPRIAPVQPRRSGRTSPAPRTAKRQEPRLVDDTSPRRGHCAGTAQMVVEQAVIGGEGGGWY